MAMLPQIDNSIDNTTESTALQLPSKTYKLNTDVISSSLILGEPTIVEGKNIEITNLAYDKIKIPEVKGDTDQEVIEAVAGKTEEGYNLHITDADLTKENQLIPEGNTEQFTTTGKNLFDKDTMGTRIYRYIVTDAKKWSYSTDSYSVAIPCEPNKTYTISHSVNTATIFRCGYIKTATYSGTADIDVYSRYVGTTALSYTITTGEDATYLIFQANAVLMPNIINVLQVEQRRNSNIIRAIHRRTI